MRKETSLRKKLKRSLFVSIDIYTILHYNIAKATLHCKIVYGRVELR